MAAADDGTPDVDALVAELRARIDERRRAGVYPAGLEDGLAIHARRYLHQRVERREPVDLRGLLGAVAEALPLETGRIPIRSGVPGGRAFHRAVARLVRRQTQGALEQVQGFAQPVHEALEALVEAVEDLSRELEAGIAPRLDAVLEIQAAQERAEVQGGARSAGHLGRGSSASRAGVDALGRRPVFHPWYSSERFEDEFRGGREVILERYRDLADRLAGCGPVLDVGCGRGEFLELLEGLGIEASGVDLDAELVKAAADRGLAVEHGDGLRCLGRLEDASLGGLVLIQVIEHLTAQEVVDLVALAAEKVRPGGRVFVETVNPQSLYVFAHSFYLDPTHLCPVHPAYLDFLFREAGFAGTGIEWRSPPPAGDVLEEVPASGPSGPVSGALNRQVRRLNQLLFAPQDYLLAATR